VGAASPTGEVSLQLSGAAGSGSGEPAVAPLRRRVVVAALHAAVVIVPGAAVATTGYFLVFLPACDRFTLLGTVRNDCRRASTEGWSVGLAAVGVTLAVLLLLIALPQARHGQTPVMRRFGTRLADRAAANESGEVPFGFGRATLRLLLATMVSLPLAGLGLWWVLWDRRHAAWHDLIVDSRITPAEPGAWRARPAGEPPGPDPTG
jgi:uncharacterized RDD family membrane protein YckC